MEIKATYGTSGISIRRTFGGVAESLIVLRLSKDPDLGHEVVYNGPYELVHSRLGRSQSNGAAMISLGRLRGLNAGIPAAERVPYRHHG